MFKTMELGDRIEVISAEDVYKTLKAAKEDAYKTYMGYKNNGLDDVAELSYARFREIQDIERKIHDLVTSSIEPEDFEEHKVGYIGD